jgi:hypothetical protein
MAMGDNVNPHFPPRLANWLLRWFVPANDQEEIMGDLAEEFSLRVQSSDSCWSWYWGQTLRSIPLMAWKATRQGRWIRTFLVALGAYIAAGLVESVADAVLLKSVNPQSLLHTVLSLIIGLTTTASAGYVAARFRSGAETVMAVIVLLAVTALLAARVGEVPLWYGFAFLIAGPLASLAGGALFPRSRT